MVGKYYGLILGCLMVFGLSATAYGTVVVTGSVARSGQWGAIQFNFTGGAVTIDSFANGFTSGPNGAGINDDAMTLLIDNGSPLTAFTGAVIAFNDDRSPAFSIDASTSSRDATFILPVLAANSYLLAIGSGSSGQFSGDISSGSGLAALMSDFQITFSPSVIITAINGISTAQAMVSSVPAPAALTLLAFGFFAVGFARRRHG